MEAIYSMMFLTLMVLSVLTTPIIAKQLGRNPWFWLAVSIPFSIVSLCLLICLPTKQERLALPGDKSLRGSISETEHISKVPE